MLGLLSPDALARSLAELHVDVLLCAALSEPLQRELEKQRIRVRPHLCGEVQAVLHAFCAGRLDRGEFDMPGCHCRHLCAGYARAQWRTRCATTKRRAVKSQLHLI